MSTPTRILVAGLLALLVSPVPGVAQQLPRGAPVSANPNTITTGGTAQVLFTPQQVLNGCRVVNPPNAVNGETLYVDDTETASPTAPGVIPLPPGGFWRCDFIPSANITVYAATTGHVFSASAW